MRYRWDVEGRAEVGRPFRLELLGNYADRFRITDATRYRGPRFGDRVPGYIRSEQQSSDRCRGVGRRAASIGSGFKARAAARGESFGRAGSESHRSDSRLEHVVGNAQRIVIGYGCKWRGDDGMDPRSARWQSVSDSDSNRTQAGHLH